MAESLWKLPFGRHKHEPIETVPNSYLKWLSEQDWLESKYKDKLPIVEKELDYRKRFDIVIKDERDE